MSEEFFDNEADFDNVHNLIDAEEHQAKIAELKEALRRRQLELYDSGLLPEQMRMRRAAEHGVTIYELVRDPKLYPLAAYLDAADLALERKSANLGKLRTALTSEDEGLRWWAIVGLHLLEKTAAPAVPLMKKALDDESHEVRILAAWTLVRLGESEEALACLSTRSSSMEPTRRVCFTT